MTSNGGPAAELHRSEHLDVPYPDGESWRQATDRVGRFLADLPLRWEGRRIVVVGHSATRWGLDRFIDGAVLADLNAADFSWRPGWEYLLTEPR
jgi:2,3-bisphosphoglycerate-dependent phosphoglycerate mutase